MRVIHFDVSRSAIHSDFDETDPRILRFPFVFFTRVVCILAQINIPYTVCGVDHVTHVEHITSRTQTGHVIIYQRSK